MLLKQYIVLRVEIMAQMYGHVNSSGGFIVEVSSCLFIKNTVQETFLFYLGGQGTVDPQRKALSLAHHTVI